MNQLKQSIIVAVFTLVLFSAQTNAQNKRNSKPESSKLSAVKIENDSLTVLYGNSLIEKLQEEGTFEACLQAASAGEKHQFRSMAYVGDQVHFRIRPEQFGNHKAYLVDQWQADRVIMAFGGNEAYQGPEGLDKFKKDLVSYLEIIIDRHPDCEYILCSPIAAEKHSKIVGFDTEGHNENLALYTQAMAEVASAREVKFVDLYQPTSNAFADSDGQYTYDGVHLKDAGASLVGALLAKAINGEAVVDQTQPGFASLRAIISRKAYEVAQSYHPSNGISYYGTRQRTYEYFAEIPHHLKLANILDEAIWQQANNLGKAMAMPELPVLKAEMPTKKPKNGLGVIKTAKEDLKDFQLENGYEVNCFASSEDFPELINPLQMQVDTKGRVWVSCYASYPHPLPGAQGTDTILIFEDTDNDGRADKRTVFANDLLLPDGFVLYKKGALVSVSKKLIYLEDTDGDGKADLQEEVIRGFDNTDTHHSGYLARSPRGDLIMSEALFHRGQFEALNGVVHTKDTSIMTFDLATRKLTVDRQTESPNPWKITYNRYGAAIQFYGGGQIIDADIHNVYTPMGLAAPTQLGMPFRYDKGCSAEFVESPHFPKEWQGGLLTSHLLRTNEINFTPLKYVDGAYKSAGSKVTLIKSKNKIFRPTDLIFGTDGSLLISDFYYPIIGHAQHSNRDKQRDHSNGRIWRVTRKGAKLAKTPDYASASTAQLVNGLKHPLLKIRQVARLELENRPEEEVLAAIAAVESSLKGDDLFSLEVLWLKERFRSYDDTTLIKKLLASSDLEIQRAAVRSLRKWYQSLGSDFTGIVDKLVGSSDERVKILLVGVLSHLQLEDDKWASTISLVEAKAGTPLAYGKEMASWKDRPSIAPEFPLLKVKPGAYLDSKLYADAAQGAVLYFKNTEARELVFGHAKNPNLRISVNDKPVLIPSGSPHTKTSQNTVFIQKGYNKLELKVGKSKRKVAGFDFYICDKKGAQPGGLEFAESKSQAREYALGYKQQIESNWEEFAEATFKKHCANCHALEAKAVGPPLKGLFGRTQTVVETKTGAEKEMTVNEAYLRKALDDPLSEYPKGYPPAMVPLPISDTEKDILVRWIKTL